MKRSESVDKPRSSIDEALAQLEELAIAEQRDILRKRTILLEIGVDQDCIRHDRDAVLQRVTALSALEFPHRPAWGAEFLRYLEEFTERGKKHSSQFLLNVAVGLAEKMQEGAETTEEKLRADRLYQDARNELEAIRAQSIVAPSGTASSAPRSP